MASTGIINATLLAIYVGATKIDVQSSASLSLTQSPRKSLNKDSGGWEANYAGAKSWEISGDAEFKIDATEGFSQLFTAYIAGTAVTVKLSTAVSGDKEYTGSAQISKLEMSGGVEENGSISYSFTGSGALAEATIV